MKELSIEEKAKRYDEALEKAKNYHSPETVCNVRIAMENLFPELKENEDERIRKEIINYFQCQSKEEPTRKKTHNKWIAWLEKQGEQKSYGQRKECTDCQFNYAGECKGYCDMKRGEQKPTDKVEPKFKVGDFIVNDYCMGRIVEITNDAYLLDTEQGIPFSSHSTRLWDITKDAKDGDVLATLGYILIFKKLLPKDGGVSYCHYDFACSTPQFNFNKDDNWYFGKEAKVYPATKEQRNILFQKMKEAGYEWDADKKELKKTEQKQVIDYPDSLPKDNWEFVHEFVSKFGRVPKDEDELNVLVEYVLKRQKLWSEEDGRCIRYLIGCLEVCVKGTAIKMLPSTAQKYIEWLKSIRPQNTWKPSKEMLEALYRAVPENVMEKSEDEILLDKLYQGLKYGRVISK